MATKMSKYNWVELLMCLVVLVSGDDCSNSLRNLVFDSTSSLSMLNMAITYFDVHFLFIFATLLARTL